VDWPNLTTLRGYDLARTQVVDLALPLALTAPALYLLLSKIRQLAIVQEQLSVFASTDSLTDLMNRRAFITCVETALAPSRRRDATTLGALLVLDADHFKVINDRFGHDVGDEALRLIAAAIRGALRDRDIVGRVGGEEFSVFLPGTDGAEAQRIAERIRQAVAAIDFRPAGERHPLTVSVGGAVFARRIAFQDLYRIADRRLYAAKDAGRDRVDLAPVPAYAAAA
jgi:diguanylate cyclase (GGDEF)-like protein